jgi:hypothetical protein
MPLHRLHFLLVLHHHFFFWSVSASLHINNTSQNLMSLPSSPFCPQWSILYTSTHTFYNGMIVYFFIFLFCLSNFKLSNALPRTA